MIQCTVRILHYLEYIKHCCLHTEEINYLLKSTRLIDDTIRHIMY